MGAPRGRAGRHRAQGPQPSLAGSLVFEHAVFTPEEASGQRMILYSPVPEEDTPRKLTRLIDGYEGAAAPVLAAAR